MSLADSIYEASDERTQPKSLIDILVDKAVENSVSNRPDQYSVYQLHMRGKEVWNGHEQIEETERNVHILTGYEEKLSHHIIYLFWPRLKDKLPVLNLGYIQISNNLLWDKTNGEIINIKEEYESQVSEEKH